MTKLVQKFGGTSVASPHKIISAAQIALNAQKEGYQVATVVSAMGQTTDELISLAKQVHSTESSNYETNREMDMLLSTGEQVSIALFSLAIQALGGKSRSFTGAQAGILTEDKPCTARILEIKPKLVEESLARGEIAIIAGFQGKTADDQITTLGRGGSDTTAVAMANALGANRCDIYTDVSGIYSADPRYVQDARKLSVISYEEMLELAAAGAQVMNARSVELAMSAHVPLRVRPAYVPGDLGTLITHKILSPRHSVSGVALDIKQSLIRLTLANKSTQNGNSAALLTSELIARLTEAGVYIDLLNIQNIDPKQDQAIEVFFSVESANESLVKSVLTKCFQDENFKEQDYCLECQANIAKVSVIGLSIPDRPEIAIEIFRSLSHADIEIKAMQNMDLRISLLIDKDKAFQAVRLIHDKLALFR